MVEILIRGHCERTKIPIPVQPELFQDEEDE